MNYKYLWQMQNTSFASKVSSKSFLKSLHNEKFPVILISVGICFAFIIRLYYANHYDFWYDEAALILASKNWSACLMNGAFISFSPLYLLVMSGIASFSLDELLIRLPSVLAGTLTVALTGRLIYLLSGSISISAIGVWIAAISPIAIFYSGEAREYSCLTAVLFAFLSLLMSKNIYSDIRAAFMGALLIYIAPSGVIYWGCCIIIAPIVLGEFRLSFYKWQAVALFVSTPILFLEFSTYQVIQQSNYWIPNVTKLSLLYLAKNSIVGYSFGDNFWIITSVIILLTTVPLSFVRYRMRIAPLIIITYLPVLFLYAVSLSGNSSLFIDRIMTPSIALQIVLICTSLPTLQFRRFFLVFFIILVMFVGAMGILRGKLHPDFLQRLGVVPREPIREIAKTLQTQCGPNTKILHYSGKTLLPIREVYYREHSSQFLVKPDSKKHTELLEYNNPAVWEIADLVPAEISKFNSEKILCLVSYSWIGHDEDNDVRKWLYNNYNMVFSRKIGNGFVEKFNKKE